MKNITTKQFQVLTDINLAWDFMTDVYSPFWGNGAAAPFFEYAVTSTWMNKDFLYLDRFWLDGDKVVGFVFTEDTVTSIFFSLRPGYEELADEMIAYAVEAFPNFNNEKEFVLFVEQKALIRAAEKQGYTVVYEDVDRLLDFSKSELDYKLPTGFHFVNPLKGDALKLAMCMWRGFNEEKLGPFVNWDIPDTATNYNPYKSYNGVLSSTLAPPPHSTYEYNVIVANEKEEYVCFSGMWWVDKNKLAYMEPLCTVPEYRHMGLASAALTRHYHRLKRLGARYMTGGGNEFYRKIGYKDEIHWLHLKNRGDA